MTTCPGCERKIATDADWKRDHPNCETSEGCWCESLCWRVGACEPDEGWPALVTKLRAEIASLKEKLNDRPE